MSEKHPLGVVPAKKHAGKGQYPARGQVVSKKFVTKNAHPIRKKVDFAVDHDVIQNGDLPLSARKGSTEELLNDRIANKAGRSQTRLEDQVLPDMNPKPFGLRERKVHSIEHFPTAKEEVAPMTMPILRLGNGQPADAARRRQNQQLQDLQARYMKLSSEADNESSARKSQNSQVLAKGEGPGKSRRGIDQTSGAAAAKVNILGSEPRKAAQSSKFVNPKSLNRTRKGDAGKKRSDVHNDYVETQESDLAPSGGDRKTSTHLPDASADRRRPGRNFVVQVPKTLGKPDKRGVFRTRRGTTDTFRESGLEELSAKKAKTSKQNNSHRDNYHHNSQHSPIKDMVSQMYESHAAMAKKQSLDDSGPDGGARLDTDNDYVDTPVEDRQLQANTYQQGHPMALGIRSKYHSRRNAPIYNTEKETKTSDNINAGAFQHIDWFQQSETGIDGTKLGNDLSVFETSHEKLRSRRLLMANQEQNQTAEEDLNSKLPSIVGAGQNEATSDSFMPPVIPDRYKQNYSQLTNREPTGILLPDEEALHRNNYSPRDDFALATSPRVLNDGNPSSSFRLKQSKDSSAGRHLQPELLSGNLPGRGSRPPAKLESIAGSKTIRNFVEQNTQFGAASQQQSQQQLQHRQDQSQSYRNQNKLFLQSFEGQKMPSDGEYSETQQTHDQIQAEHRIHEGTRHFRLPQDLAKLRPASEHASESYHQHAAAAAAPEQNATSLTVEIKNDRIKQMKTVKAADRQQLQYPLHQQDQGAARTPHGGAAPLSEPDNKSSNFHRRTESQKMSSEMTPMHQLNLSMLSKKQDEFRDQFREQRSLLRFRYPNIDINDKEKLETAYGPTSMKNVVRPHGLGARKGSKGGSRDRSGEALREDEQVQMGSARPSQNTQIHAKETSVNSMNQSGALFDGGGRKISFNLKDKLKPKTFQPPTAGHSSQLSHKTTIGGFHVVRSVPRNQAGSLSPMARKSVRAPETGNLAAMDPTYPIVNLNIPISSNGKPNEPANEAARDSSAALYQEREDVQLSMPDIQLPNHVKHGKNNFVFRQRGNTEVSPVKRSQRARNASQLKGQTEQRQPKVKSRLERNQARLAASNPPNRPDNNRKRSLDLREQYKLESLRSKLRKFDQVEDYVKVSLDAGQQERLPQESSMERYYRLYVNDGPDSIKNTEQPQYTEKFKAQLAAAAQRRHKLECLELRHVSKDGYQKAMQEINKLSTVQDTLALAEHSADAKAVLHSHMKGCDCPHHQNKMIQGLVEKKGNQDILPPTSSQERGPGGHSMCTHQSAHLQKNLFSSLTMRRPCCRKSCSTVHNPMLHYKRFNQAVSGQMPETDPKKVEKAAKKAEKEEKKQKLDRLSFGLMNLLQEKQDQLSAQQAHQTSMSMDDGSNLDISQHNNDSPLMKLEEIRSGPILDIESAKLRDRAVKGSALQVTQTSKITDTKSQANPLKLLADKSVEQRKVKIATVGEQGHKKSKTQMHTTQQQSGEDMSHKKSREIVSFAQVEIIQSGKHQRSASKEILPTTITQGRSKKARKHLSNLSQGHGQQMDKDVEDKLLNVASSRSMESFVEREVQEIVGTRKKSGIINSSRAGNSRHETPRSNVRFDLPFKKIKTKERSPDSGSLASKKSKMSSHGLKLTKMLKSSLRKKVLDNQKNNEVLDKDGKGKDKKGKKKGDKEPSGELSQPPTPKQAVVDDEPKTYERIKYEEALERERNAQEKIRQEAQKIKDALAAKFAQTIQGKLPFLKRLQGPNNDDLTLSLEKNKSIEVTQRSIEAPKMIDLASRNREVASAYRSVPSGHDDFVNVGQAQSLPPSNQQTVDPKFETAEGSQALSASPSRSAASEQKVQQALFKRLMSIMDQADGKHTKVLTELECRNYYLVLKEESLRAQMTSKQRVTLTKKVMKTLEQLMNDMMLAADFKVISDAIKKATNADQAEKRVKIVPANFLQERENARLIKLLLRCIKMSEAKEKTMKILMRAKNREELKATFMEGLVDMAADEVYDNYQSLLKTSCKIYTQIETLRADNPLLNRPFMYQGQNLQPALVKEQVDMRNQILSSHPLVKKESVSLVLDKTGRIVHHAQLVQSLKEQAAEQLQKRMKSKLAKTKEKNPN